MKAASINPGLLKWMPEKFRRDPDVFLTAVLNEGGSFMGMLCYFDSEAFRYVTQDMNGGNCYDYDYLPATKKLIAEVEAKIAYQKNK